MLLQQFGLTYRRNYYIIWLNQPTHGPGRPGRVRPLSLTALSPYKAPDDPAEYVLFCVDMACGDVQWQVKKRFSQLATLFQVR